MCKQKSKTDSKKDIMERQREHFWKAIEFICTELMKIHLVFKSKYSKKGEVMVCRLKENCLRFSCAEENLRSFGQSYDYSN